MATKTQQPPPPPASVTSDRVHKAITALLKWKSKKSETQKPQLLEEDEFIYLILTLKKIPGIARVNPYKIPVPNPLIDPVKGQTELCLILDDRPKSGLTKEEVKQKVSEENLPISKIIRLSKLKANYQAYESRRKLCDSFDMFFTDRRIVHLLPRLIGKEFFRKKKIPVSLDLTHKNWKEQIERACKSALVFLRTGTCCVVKVGRMSMGIDEIVENVVTVVNGVAEIVPKKWSGIRSFHLKLSESLALPIYQAMPEFKMKIESGIKVAADGDGTLLEEELVKEEKKAKKKRGRIQEVRYMDTNENAADGNGDVTDGCENDVTEMGTGGLQAKKRKKGGDKHGEEKFEKAAAKVKRKEGAKGKIADGVKVKKQKKDSGDAKKDSSRKKKSKSVE